MISNLFYSKKKLLLSFEFAVVLSDVAKQMNIDMTQDIVMRAEELLLKELGHGSADKFACDMQVFVLAVLEPKDV